MNFAYILGIANVLKVFNLDNSFLGDSSYNISVLQNANSDLILSQVFVFSSWSSIFKRSLAVNVSGRLIWVLTAIKLLNANAYGIHNKESLLYFEL